MQDSTDDWKVFVGTIVHSTEECPLVVLTNHVIGVHSKRIQFLAEEEKLQYLKDKYGFQSNDVTRMHDGQMLFPGFIDTHIHACQYSFIGTSFDKPLLEWLETITYPIENKFSDLVFAERINRAIVKRTLKNGTTTAQYFSTIHKDAAFNLCKVARELGQRVFVGKTTMDFHACNENSEHYYMEKTEDAANSTERFILDVQALNDPFAVPVVTPRFAICNTSRLMFKLGEIAATYDVPIQSHLAESVNEIKLVHKLFSDIETYTEVYQHHGLLNHKTVMAHCVHLTQREIDILKETGSSIAHCPSSNYNLSSGLCNVSRLLSNGIKVSLGTDVGGGHNASIMSQIREGFTNSVALTYQQKYQDGINGNLTSNTKALLSYFDMFRLATLGGAQCLGIDNETGNFEVGKYFDAILVNLYGKDSAIDYFEQDDINTKIMKFLTHGDDRNMENVYVAGKLIKFGSK